MILQTERLTIRPITMEDKNEIFEYRRDKATNKYQGWIPETIADVEAFIGKLPQQINVPETWFQFAIVERATQKVVGDLGVHFIGPDNRQAEIGCTLNKAFHKRGYATEAIRKVLDYLFNTLSKHRVTTSIDPENISSIRLVERIGFRKEAHFIESLWMKGQWVDDVIYALLEKDWSRMSEE